MPKNERTENLTKSAKKWSTAATTDERQTEVVQTLQILGSHQELHFQNNCKERSTELCKGNFFYFIWPSLEILFEQFCLWLLAIGNFSNCISAEQFFPKMCDRFQGSIPAELDLISSKARTDDRHPKQRAPLWDIRADVIGRRDNRFILQHVAVTSFLARSFLAQHILLNWDILLIRILLRESF